MGFKSCVDLFTFICCSLISVGHLFTTLTRTCLYYVNVHHQFDRTGMQYCLLIGDHLFIRSHLFLYAHIVSEQKLDIYLLYFCYKGAGVRKIKSNKMHIFWFFFLLM